MITQRAAIIGSVGGCFYLITIVNSLPSYFYVLTWLAASALVACFGLALLSLQGLGCLWRVERRSAAEDPTGVSGPVLQVELSNAGTLNKTGMLLEAHLLSAAGACLIRRFLVEALPSRAQLSTELTLTGLPRGSYEILEVRVVGSDVLGLFRAFKRVRIPRDMAADTRLVARSELATALRRFRQTVVARRAAQEWGSAPKEEEPRIVELLVGPATVNYGRGATGVSREAAGGESAASDLTGRGDEIRGTRPYVAGDDLRSVHWKSTARLGELVVREFDRTTRAESVVVWDGGEPFGVREKRGALAALNAPVHVPQLPRKSRRRRGRDRRITYSDIAVEQGLRLVASLCRALTEGGKPCALLRLDSDPVFVASPKRQSHSMVGQFGDALAVADVARNGALPEALAVFLRNIPPGADVFLVTALGGDSLRKAVHALQRLGTTVTVVLVGTGRPELTGLDVRMVSLDVAAAPDDEMAPVRAALAHALAPHGVGMRFETAGTGAGSGSGASTMSDEAPNGSKNRGRATAATR